MSGRPLSRTQPANCQLARLGAAVIADALRRFGLGILEAELDMVQPGLDQAGEPLAVQRHARGDQIAVEPGGGGMAHQLLEIAPGGGLAAGEMDLQGAQRRGLVDDPLPDLGAQLLPRGDELQRVGAIGALQRAAVGQLGEDRQGRGQGFLRLPP